MCLSNSPFLSPSPISYERDFSCLSTIVNVSILRLCVSGCSSQCSMGQNLRDVLSPWSTLHRASVPMLPPLLPPPPCLPLLLLLRTPRPGASLSLLPPRPLRVRPLPDLYLNSVLWGRFYCTKETMVNLTLSLLYWILKCCSSFCVACFIIGPEAFSGHPMITFYSDFCAKIVLVLTGLMFCFV